MSARVDDCARQDGAEDREVVQIGSRVNSKIVVNFIDQRFH